MSRDDLFDADPPEEKDAAEEPDEEFFFEITEDESGADESIVEESFAGKPPVEESPPDPKKPTGGSSQRILMLLLLLVVLLAAGYFFMGDLLLTPAPEPVVKVEKAQPQKIKIPPRKQIEQEQQAVKEVQIPAEQVAGVQPDQTAASKEQPAGEARELKPAAEAVAVAVDLAEEESAVSVAQGPAEEAAGAGEQGATEAAEAVAVAEPVAEQPAAMTSSHVEQQPEVEPTIPSATESVATSPHFVLQVGAFVVDTNLDATLSKVKKLGFEPVVLERKKSTTMTRLRVGAYPESVAREKLQELQQLIPSAFLLHEDQQMVLYAGSYYNINRARSMADKLFQHEIRIEEEPVEIQVPMKIVRFGDFDNSAAASEVAGRAKKSGLDTLVVKRN